MTSYPRALGLPRVELSENPEMVVFRVVVEGPPDYDYLRTTLTPAEARQFAVDLLCASQAAETAIERRIWMERRRATAASSLTPRKE